MFIVFIDTELPKGYHNIHKQQEAVLVKRNRVLGLILSAAIAFASVGTVSGGRIVLERETSVSDNPTAVVSQTSDGGNNGVSVKGSTMDSTVEINADNLERLEDENDIFYEPEEESVSTLEDSTTYINDAVTVFFSDDATLDDKQKVVDSLGGEIVGRVDFMNEYEIKIERSDFYEINNLCNELTENDKVEFASCSLAEKVTSDYVPNDPWSIADWDDGALERSYEFSNWWIRATDIDKAWDYDEYFSDIDVGIVDTGFDPTHEDLEGKLVFPNGFFEKNNIPSYHGNHVAGIIGAKQDNEKGLTGIVRDGRLICVDWQANEEQGQKWNSDARIMTGFVNVVRAGARVVNFSLGSSDSLGDKTERLQIVKDVEGKFSSYYIAKMLQRGYDFICCQSAGNGVHNEGVLSYAVDASNNGTFCPITVKNAVKTVKGVTPRDIVDRVIIVAAAQFNGKNTYEQADFSNGGSQVSICAPGCEIYSASYYGKDGESRKTAYEYLSGTSMAAPIVTGIASLVWSINPSFTGAQVKHFVCDEANTKYEVADSRSELHLPTGTMRMVNAQLAVEAALREIETYGTVTGQLEWLRLTPRATVAFTVKNSGSCETYRLTTDTAGSFSVKLPAGEYVLEVDGEKKKLAVTTGETTDIGRVASKLPLIDFDAYSDALKDSTREILSKLMIY